MDHSKGSNKQTLVEEGTELKGTLKSTCQVVVNGSIDGQIEAPSLTVTETGTVLGTVRAKKLRSEGTLAGDIDAEDVYLSGTVRSNTMIRAKKLEVKLMPERGKLEVTFGECLMEVGADPAHQEDAEPMVSPEVAEPPAQPLDEAPAVAADARPQAATAAANDAASVSQASALQTDDEPTWSDPPPRTEAATPTNDAPNEVVKTQAETDETDEQAAADPDAPDRKSRARRRRERDQRDSQAPPA